MGRLLFVHEAMCSDKPDSKFTSPFTTGGELAWMYLTLNKHSAQHSANIRRCGTNRDVVANVQRKQGCVITPLNSGLCGHMVDSHALGLVASQICVTDRVQTHSSRLNIGLLVFSCQELSKRGKIYLKKKKDKKEILGPYFQTWSTHMCQTFKNL